MTTDDDLQRCGIGIRGVAMTIDAGIWFVLLFVAIYPIAAVTGNVETTASGTDAQLEGTLGVLGFAVWLALGIGYHTVLEWQYSQTLGKRLVAIRALNEDGTALSLRSSLLRNGLRLIDWLPAFYLLGIVLVLVSDRSARLGDRVADTMVVRS